MSEYDWVKKFLKEETISDETLGVFKDWLLDRADERYEKVKYLKIKPEQSTDNHDYILYRINHNIFFHEIGARRFLSRYIIEVLIE